jgi:hypothetical protein
MSPYTSNQVFHFCWVCNKRENCKESQCDYREEFQAHGTCMFIVKELRKTNWNLMEQNRRLIEMMEKWGT